MNRTLTPEQFHAIAAEVGFALSTSHIEDHLEQYGVRADEVDTNQQRVGFGKFEVSGGENETGFRAVFRLERVEIGYDSYDNVQETK